MLTRLRLIVLLGLAGPGLGLLWVAHTRPLWLLQPAVMVPLFLVMTLAPAAWRLWASLSDHAGGRRWIDRRVD